MGQSPYAQMMSCLLWWIYMTSSPHRTVMLLLVLLSLAATALAATKATDADIDDLVNNAEYAFIAIRTCKPYPVK